MCGSPDPMREVVAGNDRDWIAERNPDALLADGFDQAILGICEVFGSPPVVAYDREECIQILIAQAHHPGNVSLLNDADYADLRAQAETFFEINVAGSYMGAHTPAWIHIKNT